MISPDALMVVSSPLVLALPGYHLWVVRLLYVGARWWAVEGVESHWREGRMVDLY